jgi:hypothetical protein
MGSVVVLPKQSRATRQQAEQLRQLAFDLEMPDEARAHLDNALYRITETPGRRWLFVMINPDQFRFVSKAIQGTRNVATTFAVWNSAISYIRMDTGEIMASREKIAEEVGAAPRTVSTAMSDLVKIGAIVRHRRGRSVAYFVNPNVGWNGGEGARQEAAKEAPQLRLVMPGDHP